jgi:arsenate reductase (thioredoxin)
MPAKTTVLFLCTGNSARSILAEAILAHKGHDRFRSLSAGSFPKGEVHPQALETLRRAGLPTQGSRSKSWDEFAGPDAPQIDIVVTVCDNAAGEICPAWPGGPLKAHWGIDDPAAAPAEQQEAAFRDAYRQMEARIDRLVAVPIETMPRDEAQQALRRIGAEIGSTGEARRQADAAQGVTIYHNPECATSRNTLAMIRNAGIEPEVIEYLKDPPSRALLIELMQRAELTPRQLLREKGTPYAELGLGDPQIDDEALIDAMMKYPILINRPLVVTPLGVRLCRPSEVVLEILPGAQRGAFVKEDGERVIDDAGRKAT